MDALIRMTSSMLVLPLVTACVELTATEPGSPTPSVGPTVSVADIISMTRIQDNYGMDQEFLAITPDGSRLATVVWRGDLEAQVNVYSLLVLDLDGAATVATPSDAILNLPFAGDSTDQAATPMDQLAFLDDNETIVFRGTLDGNARQVHSVNSRTRELRTLTSSDVDIEAYAVHGDGRVHLYQVNQRPERERILAERLRREGGFAYDPGDNRELFPFQATVNQLFATDVIPEAGSPFVPLLYAPSREEGGEPVLVFDGGTSSDQAPSPESLGLEGVEAGGLRGSLAAMLAPRFPEAPVHSSWRPVAWSWTDGILTLQKGDSMAFMERDSTGWSALRPLGGPDGLNRRRPILFRGHRAFGVVEDLTDPPEVATVDLASGDLRPLTDLNPDLRERVHGSVEQIRFRVLGESTGTGWVVRPVGFRPGERYPLVVLFANETEREWDRSYLIDGRANLSGHVAQPLAAEGFMVLFTGTPAGALGGIEEITKVSDHVLGAVRHLIDRGEVDPNRVGVSGWSRSAWYTEQLLIHGDFPWAAATTIDGGSAHYGEQFRPYTDDELRAMETPILTQAHDLIQLSAQGAMADRLRAMGSPADVLYFPAASHSTVLPLHRRTSLNAHLDWWRFWLQGREDPDPAKEGQYQRWREMREGWENRTVAP